MTLASHARGPEFEPRCEYFHFFSQKKNIEQQNQKSREKNSFLPLHHAHLSHCLLLIQEALIMIQACIMYLPRIDWVWKFRIQVFSKLVESTNSSLGSKHTYSVPQTLLRFSNILCEQKKIKTTTKTYLKMWLVNKKKLDSWWRRSTSQHPEIVQDRGHGPGARASPALDPWTWLKQYS